MTTTCSTRCAHLQHRSTFGRTGENRHPMLSIVVCGCARCEGGEEGSPLEFKHLHGIPPRLVPSSSFSPLLMLSAHRQKPCPCNVASDQSCYVFWQGPSGFEFLTGAVPLSYGEEFWFLLQSQRASREGALALGK